MLGAIAGGIIGSVHEFEARKTKEFPLFVAESRKTVKRFCESHGIAVTLEESALVSPVAPEPLH